MDADFKKKFDELKARKLEERNVKLPSSPPTLSEDYPDDIEETVPQVTERVVIREAIEDLPFFDKLLLKNKVAFIAITLIMLFFSSAIVQDWFLFLGSKEYTQWKKRETELEEWRVKNKHKYKLAKKGR